MSLLTVTDLAKSFGPDHLFSGVSFRLEWRQKLGLVGRNGAGKTTLLRILAGEQEADRGTVQFLHGVKPSYLKQEWPVDPQRTVLQEAEAAFAHVLEMEARLRELEHLMGHRQGDELQAAMDDYGLLRDRFEAMGGYESLRDIPGVLSRLGFVGGDLDKRCGRLSGGEKTRLALARMLLSGPDLLLLDEPTNHLDIEATEWLEGFLRDFGGAVIVVSHDRMFIDRVAGSIGDLSDGKLTLYTGNYTAFAQQKEANRRRQAEVFEREQREIARLMEFFEKWKNTPSKVTQARMRKRWAERIQASGVEKPQRDGKGMKVSIKPSQMSGSEVVTLENVGKRYGDRVLFEGLSGLIQRGDRIGVIGPNGAGKSTLVKILLGRETPSSGWARLGASVSVGYFAQDTSDLDLDATVLENMLGVAELTPTEARTHLGRFLFTADDAFRVVRLLSGGEKNKLVLAQLTCLQPNLLVLDEPTNHLDLDSRDALGRMLKEYSGSLILVSHDRYLLEQVATRTLALDGRGARLYDLTYQEYRERLRVSEATAGTPRAAAQKAAAGNCKPLAAGRGEAHATPALHGPELVRERRRARIQVELTEQRVGQLEERLHEIEAALSNPHPAQNVIALSQEHGGAQAALSEAMAAWEKAVRHAESLEPQAGARVRKPAEPLV